MKAFLCILFTSLLVAEQPYRIVEDKATLPVLTPTLGERKIAKILLNNHLEAYIISDPGAAQSAAALNVAAGSWHDPKEYPGMAHFCEHMLFMGTRAYPNEFEYMQYIIENGGSVNASTWPDHTIYMFSINHNGFATALDRLSHFFIDPMFSRNSIDRELRAVDQEHAKNIENDNWRAEMIFKETGNPDHPNAHFSTGNGETLSGIPQEALRTWYEDHYSSNLMHLAVLSPLPLQELINLVVQNFSAVPNRNLPTLTAPSHMSSPQQLGHITYINPIKDLKKISLMWEFTPPYSNDQERHIPSLMNYVLSSEAPNSLIQELKKEKLVENIEVIWDRYSQDHALFVIDISLTQQGIQNLDHITESLFQTLAALKKTGIPKSIFDEYTKISKLYYQYQSRQPAFDFIYATGNGLLYEDLQTYPEKTMIPSTYDPAALGTFLNQLSPKNCITYVQADPELTGEIPDTLEKWMGAEYVVRDLASEKIAAWENATPHSQIAIPQSNPFIPSDKLALLPIEGKQASPLLIANDDSGKIYHCKDEQYLVPESALLFAIRSPLIDGSPKRQALLDIYIKGVQEKLASTLYFAESAGLHVNIEHAEMKLNLSIFGFNEKAPLLTKEIFHSLREISPSPEQFDLYKESILTAYENGEKELPVIQAMSLMMSLITNDSPTPRDLTKAIKTITYEEFLAFSQQLFRQAFIEGTIYGNLDKAEAQILVSEIKSHFGAAPFPVKQHLKRNVLVLPEKSGPFMITQNTDRQGNGVVLVVEEGPFSLEKRASQQVLARVLQNGFFETLRTKQQTAYWARAWESEIEGQLMQFFSVQSSTHHPTDLIARFELFLEDFTKNFSERMTKERFEIVRSQQLDLLRQPPDNLGRMAMRLHLLGFTYNGDFDWINKRIKSLENLSYETVAKDAQTFLSRDNQKRLALLMEGVLTSENDFRYEQVTQEEICDLGTYVAKR